ncbi:MULTISPECIES: acyl carrier protein [unclassified Pseudomonas]|uniref:acyl carrier protein n=1 Tax=unclassified Pseudomonas TaxID=196821 RepID=UPI000BC7E646|nr:MULTISPECIES: acyl carrier protein [unclassified Pseudomonas]PVZ16365.1 acyl carrier protein [Pseudomonas sp. URIL14HWK12:I12]PVZ25779.1 acyl carrier protein [Pseudomonas sp. URIL14HWK12:I10]PVZ36697.1 acyl carrier protein [Pseudomonas sp. URIL14HWK12:I11]SNZ12797.1 Acyl carrier protein [Pseudomonas sp. URIL14HWK12:I9]
MNSICRDTAYWRTRLSSLLEQELRMEPGTLACERNLSEYGLDSIVALTLVGDLEDELGMTLEPTLVWDYPSVDALAAYLSCLAEPAQPSIALAADAPGLA